MKLTVRSLAFSLLAIASDRVAAPAQQPVSRQFALLIGVDQYPEPVPSLQGASLNDVALMRELLTRRFGFPAAAVLTLTDRDATREHIIRAIRSHLGQAGPDDVVFLFFSGHGIQVDTSVMPHTSATAEVDGLDEALLVWDSGGVRATYVLDDEIGFLLDGLRARRTIVIIDACHSGTATRALQDESVASGELGNGAFPNLPARPGDSPAAFQARRVLLDEARPVIVAPDTLLSADSTTTPRPHLLLAASHDGETALAGPLLLPDGSRKPVGMFTAALYLTVSAARPSASLGQVMATVARAVEPVARKIQGAPQRPTATGPWLEESLDQLLRPPQRAPSRPRSSSQTLRHDHGSARHTHLKSRASPDHTGNPQ